MRELANIDIPKHVKDYRNLNKSGCLFEAPSCASSSPIQAADRSIERRCGITPALPQRLPCADHACCEGVFDVGFSGKSGY